MRVILWGSRSQDRIQGRIDSYLNSRHTVSHDIEIAKRPVSMKIDSNDGLDRKLRLQQLDLMSGLDCHK
jgi:hypothetical protein